MAAIQRLKFYIMTVGGATCWGLIGLFITPLYDHGFSAWDVVAIRGIFSFVFLLAMMVIFFPQQLKTRLKDHLYFAGSGVLSIALFNYFYFEAFAESSLSVAVTLLYTGPLFVTLLSRLFFKEAFTLRKGFALIFALIGCAFVVGFLPFGQEIISIKVLVLGILSGFCYALYSIFGKPVTQRTSALTFITYTFGYTSVFMLFTSDITMKIDQFQSMEVFVSALLLALVATVAGYTLYTLGLQHLEASHASILATMEPIVAVISGVFFLGETLHGWQILGIVLVLYAAVLVTTHKRKQKTPRIHERSVS